MGWLSAALYNRLMAPTEAACLSAWRSELLMDARGRVLEIGAGTGANLKHYRWSQLHALTLTEPDDDMRAILAAAAAPMMREHADLCLETSAAPAERLPAQDASVDVVVSTLVLCSVRSPEASLAEVMRVLKPGGSFVFLEHVAADAGTSRYRWQHRLEPLWRRVTDNCHITRETELSMTDAGLTVDTIVRQSMRKALPIVRPVIRGTAHKPL